MAYGILGNIDSRRQHDKETGTYHLMRSSHKKGQGERVLRLTDDTPEIDMYKISEVLGCAIKHCIVSFTVNRLSQNNSKSLYSSRSACETF